MSALRWHQVLARLALAVRYCGESACDKRHGALHSLPGAGGTNRVRGRTASTRAQRGEQCGSLRRRAARRLDYQLAGIEAPVAADSPCARNPAGGSRPGECLRMDAEAPCRLARGEQMVLRRALANKRTKFLTCAPVRAQLIENRQDQCVRHARLSAGSLGPSSAVVLPVGGEVCCGRHVLGQPATRLGRASSPSVPSWRSRELWFRSSSWGSELLRESLLQDRVQHVPREQGGGE